MRINGLVKIFNQVRGQLQAGLRPSEIAPFRDHVRSVIRDVEEICRRHGSSPDQLPAQSRMAYRFLKELDLENLPTREDDGYAPAAGKRIKIANSVKVGEYFVQKMWRDYPLIRASAEKSVYLKNEILGQVIKVEQICEESGFPVSALEGPSKQIYCWLKFLSSEDNLTLHLEALENAGSVITELRPRPKLPVHVHLINTSSIWRIRHYNDASVLKVNQGFMGANRIVWEALVRTAISQAESRHKTVVREYSVSDDFTELLIEIDSGASSISSSGKGRIHDLDESFDRLNSEYFGGILPKPAIVWNRAPTLRKFGHYQPNRDIVMLSVSLDDPKVPPYVVDFVLYHELLHKKHGAAMVNGRRLVHSPAFRSEERRFVRYLEAEDFIRRLALQHRGPGYES